LRVAEADLEYDHGLYSCVDVIADGNHNTFGQFRLEAIKFLRHAAGQPRPPIFGAALGQYINSVHQ
jgi:hypothetical protein